jgi:O-methyltransferase involved in polyketide biosynthesis
MKKVNEASQKKTVHVREIPSDLWDKRLTNYLRRTGKKRYAVVAEALRQFLDKEGEK